MNKANRALKDRFPLPSDRWLFSAFMLFSAAFLMWQLVVLSTQWATASDHPLSVLRTTYTKQLKPAIRVCLVTERIPGPSPFSNVMYLNAFAGFGAQGDQGHNDYSVDPGLPITELQPAVDWWAPGRDYHFTLGRDVSLNRVTYAFKDQFVKCVVLNTEKQQWASTPSDPSVEVQVMSFFPRNSTAEQRALHQRGIVAPNTLKLSLFTPESATEMSWGWHNHTEVVDEQLTVAGSIDSDPLPIRNVFVEGVYDVSYEAKGRRPLGEDDTKVTFDFWPTRIEQARVNKSLVLRTFGLREEEYELAFASVRVSPINARSASRTQFRMTVEEESVVMNFSLFVSALGGLVGALSTVFSMCFPTAQLMPRKARFWYCCVTAGSAVVGLSSLCQSTDGSGSSDDDDDQDNGYSQLGDGHHAHDIAMTDRPT